MGGTSGWSPGLMEWPVRRYKVVGESLRVNYDSAGNLRSLHLQGKRGRRRVWGHCGYSLLWT